ncbi:ciliogenesis and planar polarity effector 1 isoform X2 [Echeneis naucrates]|uniref:ciliogenesis and planar polarity effector 1 isoform X2 n=1 Tax=Echeneis naucrates TaxID=173247 RepID=UPI001113CA51|nr:ciliogenesis and planar polarity effector 1 isoform X2 [Echeneis naucrates]
MELNLEVVLSSSIKRKKPWPRFCWLGQEKESVFLLDDKRISEINMVSGRTKKRTPKLHSLLSSVVTMASSHNGVWLCGLLVSGELFLWNRDKDLLKTTTAAAEAAHIITSGQGNATKLSLQVSGDGMRVLLVAITGQVFLWQCMDVRDMTGVRDGAVKGQWTHIQPLEDTILPCMQDKEASQHTIFVKNEVMGDACLSAMVFTSGKNLIITCLKIQWEEGHMSMGSIGYSVRWATKTYAMCCLNPPCKPVKSRGALVPAFSPDGRLLAIILNQRQPKDTQVLYVSTQNFVSISSSLGGCGSKKLEIPSKYIRSYWVGSVSWSPSSLFLACVLKRGSLLMLARLGGLLTLTSSGCNVDLGPAQFLPLHPLVTYQPPLSAGNREASLSSSSLSVWDGLRQRYSVTWHPRLLYLIVSDGYMATVMRVLGRPSAGLYLKTLLKDTNRDLEKASCKLDKSQIHVRAWLESVSCLNLDSSLEVLNPISTCGPKASDSATDVSTLPLFLQDKGDTMGGTKELLEKVQTLFEDDSDGDEPPAGSHMEDCGRLEFASMFDTIHAQDTYIDTGHVTGLDYEKTFETAKKTPLLHRERGKIQNKLLTAWAFGMSLGNAVEHRSHLLKHILYCVVRFIAFFHLIPSSMVHTKRKNTSVSTSPLHLIKAILSFLPWDSTHSDGQCCLGLVVEFSERLAYLLLTPYPESHQTRRSQLSSQNLSTTLQILQLISNSLDQTYNLNLRTVWSSVEKQFHSQQLQLWSSDVHYVPLLQEEKEKTLSPLHQAKTVPQQPSSRLFGVWQWMYQVVQQYLKELESCKGCEGWEAEQQELSFIMSQIQIALQATGERLEGGPTLLSYPGENFFLCGLYAKSADAWRAQICEESNKSCDRSVFQETRICLALLYSLLSQYRLREAQELGDHMARLILHRAGYEGDNTTCITDSLLWPWLPIDLSSDAACAVVQSLGRFMASYFTNQPLHILPPHNVAILPPLHFSRGSSVGRLVPLCQEKVATAVRHQHLSEVWTVDYAQDLLLLAGLLPEAVWMAYHLGDWKTAVSLSLAYTSYCTDHFDFTRLRRRELHLPTVLEAKSIFQAELECLLGNKSDSQEHRDKDGDISSTDPLEGEDWDLLQVSMNEILKASVMAGVNVVSSPLFSLLDKAKDLCSYLPMLVPSGLYLPSPPLYCPQPSPNTQDPSGTMGELAEVASRHQISGVLQRLLFLLRSARCCLPAAQWYITHLRRARHILYKIKKKYSYAADAEVERAFPEALMKFVTRNGFFRRGPNKDGHLDSYTIETIICFRELCSLCWMLHVRDQLSVSCRKYQAARQHGRDEQIPVDSEVRSSCTDVLRWACRLLPFSRFLNAEEILQDMLLSLVSDLPPIPLVADTVVQAFPEEEESVRVPLREKYNSLLQRLRQCNVLEEKEEVEELMMVLIQDKHRQRRKHLGRLRRHIAPPDLYLWEKEEEDDDRAGKHGMAVLRQLSLGTSLSTSTLTDYGFPQVCSDGDTAENTFETIPPEQHCQPMSRDKKAQKMRDREFTTKTAVKIKSAIQEETHPDDDEGNEKSSLPVVGTWEFELEDEEYLNFLVLFLSYVLEKDSADGGDSSSELPLLKSFSSQLREKELNSLTFDVLTTIHRRQRDGHHPRRIKLSNDPPVFRAGYCYKPIKQGVTAEPQTPSIRSEPPMSRPSLSVSSLPGLQTGRKKGLFGLRQHSSVSLAQRMKHEDLGSQGSSFQSAIPMEQPSKTLIFGSQTSVEAVTDLQQGLNPKLEAQFPKLGRLLEWMVRWADRRVLLGHHSKTKKERREKTADEGVVIRVKASAPAVLTSLSLLQWRYTALLGADHYCMRIQVPETQWTVAPVLQPEVDIKLERESSVDTGYPGSANTPITGLDHNVQQEELSIDSCRDDSEELKGNRMPPPNDEDRVTFDAQQRCSTSHNLFLDDLDVTPEKESQGTDSEGLDLSSFSQGSISEKICIPDTNLKLEDLDFSVKAEDKCSSTSLSLQAPLNPEPQVLPNVQPEASIHTDLSDSTGVLLPNTPEHPPRLQPQSSSAGAFASVSTASSQPPSTQTPPMRQRLGEDLFRLVQNINYISLMDVLGASFSHLQLAQQSCSLAQSNINSLPPNVPSSDVTTFVPRPNALPVQTPLSLAHQTQYNVPNSLSNNPHLNQAPATMMEDQPAEQSTDKTSPTAGQSQIPRNLLSTASGVVVNHQEMQPLSVRAESPEIQFRQSRRLIPSSQGLLVTTDVNHAIASAPAELQSHGSIQIDHAPDVLGVKLLQLQHPPLPKQSAPHNPPVHGSQALHTTNPVNLESHQPNIKHNYQPISNREEEKRRNGFSVSRRQLHFYHPHDPAPRNSHHEIQTSERSRVQEFSSLPPVFPVQTPAPMEGIRLLHFQPPSHKNVTFPKLPLPSSSRPSTVIAAPMGETHLIKLLHIESQPKMILPLQTPPNHMARLMSMEELRSSVIGRLNAEEVQPRLLRVDSPTKKTRTTSTSLNSKPSMRQRRREEKARDTRKAEVTFRPNESIIPTQEISTDKPVIEEPTVAEKNAPGDDAAISLGSCESLLTGQTLLDKAMATSAELQAFAALHKRPPECHDAFTNTDPASLPTLVDKAVSASVTTTQTTQNFQDHTEPSCQDTGDTPKKPTNILGVQGHQFICVLDLDDKALHHDLPLCLSPAEEDVTPIRASSPTSAQLHFLATSVIKSAAVAADEDEDDDPQPSVTSTDNLMKPIPQPAPPLCSLIEPSANPDRITPQDAGILSDSKICQAMRTQSVGPHTSSSPPVVWFSSRLSELDTQLAALQKIADHLEMDFSNSRMLVNTIEKLTPVLAPDMKSTMEVKKTVRLSLPREVWTPQSEVLCEPNAGKEEGENQRDKNVIHSASCTSGRNPSSCYLSPHSDPSYLHTPPDIKEQLSEASGISHIWEDENLGQTELLDTAEILDELVREGYLSPTDLDLSTSHTAHDSRLDQQQCSWMSQRSIFPEDERRELRIWMRRKQRERLAAYQKHRQSLREKEHKPFNASGEVKPANRNKTTIWRTREEKERAMLLEQYNQRTREACSLASDFPTSPLILHSSSQLPHITRPISTPPSVSTQRAYSAPPNDKTGRKSQSGQSQPRPHPLTAEVQRLSLEDHSRRLGLHRPVTSLPRDRLSQVTRRGMLTDRKSHSKALHDSQSKEQNIRNQRNTRLNKSPTEGMVAGRGTQRTTTKVGSERDKMNQWKPTSELHRPLDLEDVESNIALAGLLDERDDGARADMSGMDWLENLSESTSTSLSKIDWAAIERMVAAEDA